MVPSNAGTKLSSLREYNWKKTFFVVSYLAPSTTPFSWLSRIYVQQRERNNLKRGYAGDEGWGRVWSQKTFFNECHRDSVTRFFASGFFRESSCPKPMKKTLGSFQIFQKFLEIFGSQGALLMSTTPVVNLPLVSTTSAVNFATITESVTDTSAKFVSGVNKIPSANLPQVLLTPVTNNGNNDCLHHNVNLKEKIDLYVNSITQSVKI
jgi:hypothetical protein